jgi:hypothetical protein
MMTKSNGYVTWSLIGMGTLYDDWVMGTLHED